MKKIFLFLVFLSFSFQVEAFEAATLSNYTQYIYDETQTLSSEEIQSITAKIETLKNTYTIEVLAVLINTTDGQNISQLWVEIGQTVGVGKKDVDNGVVILIAKDDREWNISTGYGVEWALPDIIVNRIGENNFPPYFREWQYALGILSALQDIEWYISKDPGVVSKLSDTPVDFDQNIWFLVRYFFIAIFVSAFIFQKDLRKWDMQNFWKKLLITYLVTLPLSYILIWVYALLVNFLLWLIASLISASEWNSTGSGRNSGGWGGGSSGHSSWWFWGGWFGGGGSSGKW